MFSRDPPACQGTQIRHCRGLAAIASLAVPVGAAAAPSPVASAGAPAQWNPISGRVNIDNSWYGGGPLRHKTDSSDTRVILKLENNVGGGGLCVRLRYNFRTTTPVCWAEGKLGSKSLGSLPAPTTFVVEHRKQNWLPTRDRDWYGQIYY